MENIGSIADMEKTQKLISLSEKINEIEKFVTQFLFPIYVAHSEKKFELFGTSVGLCINNVKYVCTASHVLENSRKRNKPVVAAMNGCFIELDVGKAQFLTDDKVDYDICLIPCESAPKGVEFFPESQFFDNNQFGSGSKQYLQGYPIAKNKAFDIHDHSEEQINTGYLKVLIKIEQDIEHEIEGVSSDSHILFHFDEGSYQKGDSEFSDVKSNSMPKLPGLSGSAIWNITDIDNPSSVHLAGIFTTLSNKIGAGTKINNVTLLLE